ncbi:2-phosphosulfolactate phosphatase [Methanococcus voltae]|uniref:2-phosphosulfolactate phosphatase n=1 Tax=Methanococcus voltae PS TaxID=523842 RepID=A0ABT2EX73_METVO|nr:2-phosphosulfolactate phosphatase [Methanococcus voltae]MBP2172819.1 2-phosphosulfolactate phosphatase [Methanococcus voltae]MCS3922559.1 2-phosphosulfolactate phosphatase [Methanococcus voltae PS]
MSVNIYIDHNFYDNNAYGYENHSDNNKSDECCVDDSYNPNSQISSEDNVLNKNPNELVYITKSGDLTKLDHVSQYAPLSGDNRIDYSNYCAIVIDVLRASTTISTLLELYDKVYITDSIEKTMNFPNSIKMGERNGIKIDEFDYGNSPVEILKDKNKITEFAKNGGNLVLTTTNGTRVLNSIISDDIYMGSINNAEAVAKEVYNTAVKKDKDIVLIPCHRCGDFAIEDYIGAALIVENILKIPGNKITKQLEQLIPLRSTIKFDWKNTILNSKSGQGLRDKGYPYDVLYSVQENIYDNVGKYNQKENYVYRV